VAETLEDGDVGFASEGRLGTVEHLDDLARGGADRLLGVDRVHGILGDGLHRRLDRVPRRQLSEGDEVVRGLRQEALELANAALRIAQVCVTSEARKNVR
jgi:hypothetical protein